MTDERAPADKDEHIKGLLEVNERQAEKLKSIGPENERLKTENKKLRQQLKEATGG